MFVFEVNLDVGVFDVVLLDELFFILRLKIFVFSERMFFIVEKEIFVMKR